MVAVKQGGNTIASFVYDGNGRRYQKIASGVTRTYLHDSAQLVEERLSSGGTLKYFDGPGIDQHLASQDQAGVVSYYAADHLGSVTDVTTSAGGVSLTRQYDPWGNPLTSGTTSGYAYTGRDWDSETSLYYYRARYYDPKVGRFASEEPRPGLRVERSAYVYVLNRPAVLIDPSGQVSIPGWDGTCASMVFEAGEQISGSINPWGGKNPGNQTTHCWVACTIARLCYPDEPWVPYLLQVAFEGLAGFGSDWKEDTAAAGYGITQGRRCEASCADICQGRASSGGGW